MTYWVVQDGFVDTIHRTLHYQGPGPLYYLIVWIFVQIGGHSEIMLRLPSILSCAFLCVVLFRFTSLIFDRSSAFLAVCVLLCLDGTLVAAVNARAYSLGLLMSVSSTYALHLWMESNKKRYKLLYILFSTLTGYTHCIFTGIFFVHVIYLCCRWKWVKESAIPTFKEILRVYLYIAVLLLPEMYQVIIIAGKKNVMSFADEPTVLDLIQVWVKPHLILSVMMGVLAARMIMKNVHFRRFSVRPDLLVLLLSWYFIPALEVFLFSLVSGTSIFAPRYYLWGLPALSILLGKILNLITPTRSRSIVVTILVILLLFYGGRNIPFDEDWSSAIAYVRTKSLGHHIPILASTGLVESNDTEWINHPEKRSYLLSPFAAYRLDEVPILLPAYFDQPGATEYLDKNVFPILRRVDEFYLVLRITHVIVNNSLITSNRYLTDKFWLVEFRPKHMESFGNVKVIAFEKI